MDLRQAVTDYLSQVIAMQIGTASDNKPWVTTVYFSYDLNLNIYWLSDPTKRHTREIEKNSHVAGTFTIPHAYGQKVRGLRFEGKARMLTGNEFENGLMIYKSRFWIVEDRAKSQDGKGSTFCYMVSPKTYYLYDEIHYPDNPNQTLNL